MVVETGALLAALFLLSEKKWDGKDGLILAFLGWNALTVAWSPDWRQGLEDLQHLGSICVLLIAARRVEFGRLWLPGLCLLALAFWFDPTLNENIQAQMIAVSLPLLWREVRGAIIWVSTLAQLVIVAGGLFLLWGTESHNGLLAICGLCVAGLMVWCPRFLPLIAASAAGAALTIMLLSRTIQLEVLDRAQLALGTLQMWLTRPVFGTGLGSFDYLWPNFQNTDARIFSGMTYLGPNDAFIFMGAAHNDWIQALAETGIVGFCLMMLAICWEWSPKPEQRVSLGLLALFMCMDAPLHNPETAVFGALLLGSTSPVAQKAFQVPWKWARLSILAVPALCISLFWGWRSIAAASHTAIAWCVSGSLSGEVCKDYRDKPNLALAYIEHQQAYQSYPLDKRYRLEVFKAFSRAFWTGKVQGYPEAIDQLYAISRTAIPDNPGLIANRIAFLVGSAGECAAECRELSNRLFAMNPRMKDAQRIHADIARLFPDE